MTKFQYAPGRPGFGSKGEDGSVGLQGLSMYFTDYDPITDINILNTRIENDLDLWSGVGSALPSDRVYVTGDLLVDSTGKVYEIDAENNTFEYKYASLNTGYFTTANVETSEYDYKRYYNLNTSAKYLIDNVYTDGTVAYYLTPDTIYDVNARDFARIEFSNIEQGDYNHFTLFTAGEDDNSAIAIVRKVDNNTFHIGNLSNTGTLRDVNLTFDVSSLRQTKQPGINEFSTGTPPGTILTNYEIQANALFNGAFTSNPASFRATYGTNDVSIYWRLSSFTKDENVNMDLYFFEDLSSTSSFSMTSDASTLRPLIFYNCVSEGSIHITDLNTTTTYKYFMNFHKNGWERRSTVKSISTGVLPNMSVTPISVVAASEGYIGDNSIGFLLNSNVSWFTTIETNPSSFITSVTSAGTADTDASIYVNLSENTACEPRTGTILVSAVNGGGNSPRLITITQNGNCVPVSLNVDQSTNVCSGSFGESSSVSGTIDVSGMLSTHTYTLDISLNAYAVNYNNNPIDVVYSLIFKVDGNTVYSFSDSFNSIPSSGEEKNTENLSIIGLKDASVITYEGTIYTFIDIEDPETNINAGVSFDVNSITITSGSNISLSEGTTSDGAGIICT